MPLQTDSPIPDDPAARIEALEELLSALPGEAMLSSELDGFLAGVLVCPRLLRPSARETAPSLTGWQGAKVGRNEPCLCGSGLKHKKCCGRH